MKYDVVIIGAGPAGIFTAIELILLLSSGSMPSLCKSTIDFSAASSDNALLPSQAIISNGRSSNSLSSSCPSLILVRNA